MILYYVLFIILFFILIIIHNIEMFYIISKLNISTLNVELITPSFSSKELALEKITDLLNSDNSCIYYINKDRSGFSIDVYKKRIGYITSSKTLKYKYKILEVNIPPVKNKKSS